MYILVSMTRTLKVVLMAFEVRLLYKICLIFYKNETNFDPRMCIASSLETARKLKALGVADDVIAQSTDLSVEEIEGL